MYVYQMVQFICECGKEFNSKIGLIYHQNICSIYKLNHNIISSHYNKDLNKYICDCGKEFDKLSSLNAHASHCKLYIRPIKEYKSKVGDKFICECGKEFNLRDSYAAHASHCKIHHEVNNIEIKKRPHEVKRSMCWDKLSDEEVKEIRQRGSDTLRRKYANGELKGAWTGKHHTEKTKQKLREAYIKRLSAYGASANFTEKACCYLDKLNKENNWNLQHGMNGGEVIICGYYVDGYDKERNIVVEYDEKGHYIDVFNNILKQKDIERQNNIILSTNCTFYRYNEVTDKLYEVKIDIFDVYNEFEKLINENKIDFTSKQTIKDSINKFSKYSYKSFLTYARKNKEIYDLIYHKKKTTKKKQKQYINKQRNNVTFSELKVEKIKLYQNAIILCCETSGIDFTKFGWSEKAKRWIKENTDISFENTLKTFIKYYPEFIEKYKPFIRKK